ncbi:placenta-specific gene 8 protein-like [Siphateles boraxobius]|uniref:placenta-specific gene 8 protein-like n=1 Tax=Siphateles boraxobius TaxID=180520 RepID=UPI0040645882
MAAVIMQQRYINRGWSSGLCDCCQDMSSCCFGFWCFPCFMCSVTGEFGEGTCLPLLDIFGPGFLAFFEIPTCVPSVSLGMRVAVRYKYDIGGNICDDIMVSCCCIWCMWCQMSREIKARKQTVIVQTVPTMFQPMATTTRVVSTQQSVSLGPVGAPAIVM